MCTKKNILFVLNNALIVFVYIVYHSMFAYYLLTVLSLLYLLDYVTISHLSHWKYQNRHCRETPILGQSAHFYFQWKRSRRNWIENRNWPL